MHTNAWRYHCNGLARVMLSSYQGYAIEADGCTSAKPGCKAHTLANITHSCVEALNFVNIIWNRSHKILGFLNTGSVSVHTLWRQVSSNL